MRKSAVGVDIDPIESGQWGMTHDAINRCVGINCGVAEYAWGFDGG